jgi:hypothetical protein
VREQISHAAVIFMGGATVALDLSGLRFVDDVGALVGRAEVIRDSP